MNRSRSRVLFTMLAVGVVVQFGAASAGAQELSVGYQFQRVWAEGIDGVNLPRGIDVDVAAPLSGPLQIVGAFDWSRRTDTVAPRSDVKFTVNYYSFGGGVRLTAATNSGIRPFAHFLAGATRISGSNSRNGEDLGGGGTTYGMIDLGTGAAMPISDALSAFGELDYRRIFTEGVRLNTARVVAGVRVAFAVR